MAMLTKLTEILMVLLNRALRRRDSRVWQVPAEQIPQVNLPPEPLWSPRAYRQVCLRQTDLA